MSYIDLHTHSPASDGALPIPDMLRRAESLGLKYFSISDHNTVDAYKVIAKDRSLFSGKIVPAVELTTMYEGEIVEILGYGIDTAKLAHFTQTQYLDNSARRIKEAAIDTKALLKMGVKLSEDCVHRMLCDPESFENFHKVGCRHHLMEEMRRHPENVKFFENEEHFRTVNAQEYARNNWFTPASPYYIDLTDLYPKIGDCIRAIKQAGGLTFLAHPFVYSPNIAKNLDDLLAAYPLDGLECHYGTFTEEQKQFMCDYCNTHSLYKSGGSDFHGTPGRTQNVMGHSAGSPISTTLVQDWIHLVKTV